MINEKSQLESKLQEQLEHIQKINRQKSQLLNQIRVEVDKNEHLQQENDRIRNQLARNSPRPSNNIPVSSPSTPVKSSPIYTSPVIPPNTAKAISQVIETKKATKQDDIVFTTSWLSSLPLIGRFYSLTLKRSHEINI